MSTIETLLALIAACLCVLILWAVVASVRVGEQKKRDLADTRSTIAGAVQEHLSALARRRMQLIILDDYGVPDVSRWNREVKAFIKKVVVPRLTEGQIALMNEIGWSETATELIERPVQKHCASLDATVAFDPAMSPSEYEAFCARLLERAGWKAQVTPASGDQGADVVAE